jgi:pimeloyl-ACP methyl ester carboxylesterase
MRHYEAGEGPPLVLIHGLMTSAYSWRYVIDALGAHFRLWIPDLPGAGKSGMPDVSYRADAMADTIARWMEASGLRGAPVIGNSLGGYLSMKLALRHPGIMSRLVNLHSPGIPIPRLHALRVALKLPFSAAVLDKLVARDPLKWVHRNVHYYDESLKSLEEARVWAEPLQTSSGRRAFWHWLADTMRPDDLAAFVAELQQRRAAGTDFPVPLQLIYARQDPMVPPIVGERLGALLPSASFHWIEKGSHFAHVDAPEAFLAIALPFLLQDAEATPSA